MKHPEYYKKDAAGHIISPIPDWADVAALDYSNAKLREYMTGMLEGWLKSLTWTVFAATPRAWCPRISGSRSGPSWRA